MKNIHAIFMAFILLPPAQAYAIMCPGSQELQPYVQGFIKDIKPVPYPQCFYTAKAIEESNVNHCPALYEKIRTNLLTAKNITIEKWICSLIPKDKNVPYDYTFTFKALYESH